MPMIHIKDWVQFVPNVGVMVQKEAVTATPDELHKAISTAWSHMSDQELLDACCGGQGPLAKFGDIPYEEYLVLKQAFDKVRKANES